MSLGHDYTYRKTDVMLTQNDCVCPFYESGGKEDKAKWKPVMFISVGWEGV